MNDLIKQKKCCSTGEQGFVLVASLMVLVILSLLGAFASSVSNTETSIASNNVIYKRAFYSGEALSVEGAAIVEEQADDWYGDDPVAMPAGVVDNADGSKANMSDQTAWSAANSEESSIIALRPPGYSTGAPDNDRIRYAVQDMGFAGGVDLSNPTYVVHTYDIYGIYDVDSGGGKTYPGKMLIATGYKKSIFQ